MENLSDYLIERIEIISYFSPEVICILAILINLFIFLFFKKKIISAKLSDFITSLAFSINMLILGAIYFTSFFNNNSYSFSILKESFMVNGDNIISRLLINVFFLLFILTTYKISRKTRFKVSLLNSILLLLNIVLAAFVSSNFNLITYVLFEMSIFLIYNYCQNTRFRISNVYCASFILINIIASVLFCIFYFTNIEIQDSSQIAIMETCISIAILLKAGLFPIYNYTNIKECKNNPLFSVFAFCLMPVLGIITYCNFLEGFNFRNEVYTISMFFYLSVVILSCAVNALRAKNMTKFIANCAFVHFCANLAAYLGTFDTSFIKYNYWTMFFEFCLFAMIFVLNINLKIKKVNISNLRSIFIHNKVFASIFSILLLINAFCIPSYLLIENFEVLKVIYSFDKITSYISFLIVFAYVLILLNSLKIIKNIYSYDKNMLLFKLKKATTPNYVIAFLTVIILIAKMFLL